MANIDLDELIKVVEDNGLIVGEHYKTVGDKTVKYYAFDNYCDTMNYDEYFKSLPQSLEEVARMVHSIMAIRYSQEHEFFID